MRRVLLKSAGPVPALLFTLVLLCLHARRAAASAELILDLRVAGGSKTALVNAVGDTVSLELYALVRDGSSVTPDGFTAA